MTTDMDILPVARWPELGKAQAVTHRPDEHPVRVYLASRQQTTRRGVTHTFDRVAGFLSADRLDGEAFPWHLVRYQHTQAVRTFLRENYSPPTCNKMLSHIRGVLKECWRLGYLDAENYHRAIDLKPVPGGGKSQAAGRMLDPPQMLALVAACKKDATALGYRDEALIAMMYGCGLRRSEVVALDLDDFDADTGRLDVKRLKSGREDVTYLDNGQRDAVRAWVSMRGKSAGPLFLGGRKGGKLGTRRLTDQAIYYVCVKLAKRAGIPAFTPHDLRRTCVSDALDNTGGDLAAVQQFVGHRSPATTVGYDRRGERAKMKAAAAIHFPWSRRTPSRPRLYPMLIEPECYRRKCKFFQGVKRLDERCEGSEVVWCDAFPNGIPQEIAYGSNPHTDTHPGDRGIQYVKIQGESDGKAKAKATR